MSQTCEELYIKNIENGIRGIKLGTKKPEDVNLTSQFSKLKPLNPFMWEDLKEKYSKVLLKYSK